MLWTQRTTWERTPNLEALDTVSLSACAPHGQMGGPTPGRANTAGEICSASGTILRLLRLLRSLTKHTWTYLHLRQHIAQILKCPEHSGMCSTHTITTLNAL